MVYTEFLSKKELLFKPVGFTPKDEINPILYPFQRDIVLWALKKGRACLFENCGLGKTPQQLEWAKHVSCKENAPVLIIAPLAVSEQTKELGDTLFDVPVTICNSQRDVKSGVNITNYEKLHRFTASEFSGVVLDESSILKNMAGATRNQIIDMFSKTPYRLACSATPSPNDYVELGNHSEFLGILSYSEMLSMFFVNDAKDGVQWRLKRHASERKFWEWVCSWAVMISKPSDLGYDQSGFDLPQIHYIEHKIPAEKKGFGFFIQEAATMDDRRTVRRETIEARCKYAADIINATDDQWVIWCAFDKESELLKKLIHNAVEISGHTEYDLRKKLMLGFAKGEVPRLVTKPKIAGFGMNWQVCHKMMFVGLSDSWEQFYQAVRRVWRFGQFQECECHIVIEEREGAVLKNIKRKELQSDKMLRNMITLTKDISKQEIIKDEDLQDINNYKIMEVPQWLSL